MCLYIRSTLQVAEMFLEELEHFLLRGGLDGTMDDTRFRIMGD